MARQICAVFREFREAVEDRRYDYAAIIANVNPEVMQNDELVSFYRRETSHRSRRD